MSRRISFVVAALAMVAVPASGLAQAAPASIPAPDPARLAEARAIIAVILPPAEREAMIRKMLDDLIKPMHDRVASTMVKDPGLRKLMTEMMDATTDRQITIMNEFLPSLAEAMAGAYAREFTLAELKDISAFATSPTGRRYLSRSAQLMGDPAIKAVNLQMATRSIEASKETMKTYIPKVADYIKAHPDLKDDVENVFGEGMPNKS